MNEPILSMSSFATGKTPFILSSGLMMRPSLSFFALMYFQMAFVTSTLLNFFEPQIAANAGLKFFGAKRPLPADFSFLIAFFVPVVVAFVALVFFVVALEVVVFVISARV